MDFKSHALFLLNVARNNTLSQLATLEKPEDWFYQPVPGANHPLWIMGHLALADNRFAGRFREETDQKSDAFVDAFWIGSTPVADPAAYPAVVEVRAYFDDRRKNLLKVIDQLTEDELLAPLEPVPENHPMFPAPSQGSWLLYAAAHESTHVGQLTVCRRGLGQAPLR